MRRIFKLVEVKPEEINVGDLFMLYDIAGPESLSKVLLARSKSFDANGEPAVEVIDAAGSLMACRDTVLQGGFRG